MIRVQNATVFLKDQKVLNAINWTVGDRENWAVVGNNGSGKTTTMRMLTSFYTPDEGRIKIDGMDTQDHDLLTRYRIGYLPENNPFYADLLVSEYLDFVADLRGMSKEERRSNIPPTVDETGLTEVFYRPIGQLSKGYKQRVGLAQAILHRPSILILDEPTEGLDPNQRVTIRDLIKSLGKERTVLISTHVMQEVETTCDRVLVISRGNLVADSPVDDLLLKAQGVRAVHIEVEGNDVERHLEGLPNVDSIEREERIYGRKRYITSTRSDHDLRPEIFALAKRRDWVLYELREERARMEDVFHDLTAEQQNESSLRS